MKNINVQREKPGRWKDIILIKHTLQEFWFPDIRRAGKQLARQGSGGGEISVLAIFLYKVYKMDCF